MFENPMKFNSGTKNAQVRGLQPEIHTQTLGDECQYLYFSGLSLICWFFCVCGPIRYIMQINKKLVSAG